VAARIVLLVSLVCGGARRGAMAPPVWASDAIEIAVNTNTLIDYTRTAGGAAAARSCSITVSVTW
jgi:hypothetical protein